MVIIMALILVVGFGVMYYLRSARVQAETEQAMTSQRLSSEKVAPVDDYIKSTLDLVASEGLQLIGTQGGHIYESQDGISPDIELMYHGEDILQIGEDEAAVLVKYLEYPPAGRIPNFYSSFLPDYPWANYPYVIDEVSGDFVLVGPFYRGFFGFNRMPPIMKDDGPNSIQEQLENFTLNRVLKIIDFAAFELENLEITLTGEPSVSVEMNVSTIFKLNYPIRIRDLTTGSDTQLLEFDSVYPINLKGICEFTDDLIGLDVTDPKFNVRSAMGAPLGGQPTISVSVLEDMYENDDMIVIEDRNSMLFGETYQFRFMRHNRFPLIYNIDFGECSASEEFTLANGSDITLVETDDSTYIDIDNEYPDCNDSPSRIYLNATDPDEDRILITFIKSFPNWVFEFYSQEDIDETHVGYGHVNLTVGVFEIGGLDNRSRDWQDFTLKVVEWP